MYPKRILADVDGLMELLLKLHAEYVASPSTRTKSSVQADSNVKGPTVNIHA